VKYFFCHAILFSFKREAALWNPVVFKREAALWNPVVFIIFLKKINCHCCQTQAKKCQFKGKVTSRSIRF